MSERNARLLAGLSRDVPIIEIGPSFNAVAPRSAGWQVTTVDHAGQEALREKYRDSPGVDPGRIEEVDIIWRGGPLEEAFPPEARGSHAALIACHVLEHIPDPIGFLLAAERLLMPAGALLLALPDKRWCFDLFRPLSTTGQVLAAHLRRDSRHTAANLFDQMAYSAVRDGSGGWGPGATAEPLLVHSLEQAASWFEQGGQQADYVDCHAWQFTPASFALLVLELGELGAIDWRVDWIRPEPAMEFLVRLRRGRQVFDSPAAREAARLALLREMLIEQRAQTDWLVGQPPPASAPVRPPPKREPLDERLAAIEARLCDITEQLPPLVETAAWTRTALRPMRAAWRRALPLRRVVARLRGRR